ncbi:hypothetical protein SEA_KINGBOB_31 [Arthrobacter phage KingBob]|uniref:RuvC-like resolvase n=1 Tax=Arthrobacter phage Sergei TaxID=2250416 RepID=A0A345KPW9_9CAUD|nr:hypothetical protein KDJ06_gp31 [Arthrobacter phage Sergei]ASZ74345.1 hypothetical protein TEMPER16_31 [Arthrobacter phage Temper16]AXH43958.1 hypothetical protein SEA_DAIBOJU_31 [Arthrobacter phage Daiboju]AXH44020.1 hypothetical protein SEA_HERB_31 [Arthrobacter phage Herb]AXH44264.1 hypothetical protein SEA_KINGBOB_31 [Arthrobacter phage KingBob]AXH45071.1 hypothetical protein SEA_SERGEI_31 [Arthrobacter phage Sergei]
MKLPVFRDDAYGQMILAVDPGDEHVGVAWLDRQEKGWAVVFVTEMTPDEFLDYILPALQSGLFRYFVLESFSLYADKLKEQIGSEMLTSQMIGAAKFAVKIANEASHFNPDMQYEVQLHMQQPAAKAPAFAILERKKYVFTAKRLKVPGQHVLDAEVHGIKFVMDTLGEKMIRNPELWDEAPRDVA